jgi:N6-adenosine-specific RNA methylase IME4
MSIQQIANLPVAALGADNCLLFLWCTDIHIATGNHVPVMRAWGFKPTTVAFTWPKRNASGDGWHFSGLGMWTHKGTEICLLGVKGAPLRLAKDVHQIIDAPIAEHSAKPPEVRCRIERLVAGPYLELFARGPAPPGSLWFVWGNEITPEQMRPRSETVA